MSVTAPQPSGTITSTELVTSVNGTTVPAENVQRVIATTKTGTGTVVDGVAVTSYPALNVSTDSLLSFPRGSNYVTFNNSTGGQVLGVAGKLNGIFFASLGTTPTIKIWDSLTATGLTLIDTFTPSLGLLRLPDIRCTIGCFITVSNASGNTSFTAFVDPTTT